MRRVRERARARAESSEAMSPHPDRLPEIRRKLLALMERHPNFNAAQLERISTPTLVMAGDHDLVLDEHTLDLFHTLPHAQLCIVPGATHLFPIEWPELTNTLILEFLQTPYRDIDRFYFVR